MVDGKYVHAELSEVLHVPSFAKNLLSVCAVVDTELTVILKDETFIILNKSRDVMHCRQKDGKLFILDGDMIGNQSHQVHSAVGEKSAK